MCLSNVTTSEPLIAEEDITVYKIIEKTAILVDNWKDLVNHGDDCIATINNDVVEGKISIDSSAQLYICTNNIRFDGADADDMLGYKYSWIYDYNVISIIVKNKEIVGSGYQTIFQKAKVVIGNIYTSELISKKNIVNIGLHSYIKKPFLYENSNCVVECVIPKDSKYFIGNFNWIRDSIVSDTLKYVKII